MSDRDRTILIQELENLLTMRLAMVLLPVLSALSASRHDDLAAFLRRYSGRMRPHLNEMLSNYEVRKYEEPVSETSV